MIDIGPNLTAVILAGLALLGAVVFRHEYAG